MKPGAYLLAFGGRRTFHRMAVAIENAGFEIRDTIMWIYGMGFPKSQNIGKQLEKRLEDEKTKQKTEHDLRLMWKRDIQKTMRNEEEQNEVLQSQLQKQSLQSSINSTSDVWREEPCLERWNNIQKTERKLQRCKVCEMSKRVFIDGEERWICNGTQTCDGKALREMFEQSGSCPSYRPQSEQQQDRKLNAIQEQCRTQENREVIEYWNKFGTALKPSFEPIIVARKPFKGSLVDNVIEYGVGGINIDECRVGSSKEDIDKLNKEWDREWNTSYKSFADGVGGSAGFDYSNARTENKGLSGRFPANTILTYDETDFDEVCGGFPNTKSQKRSAKYNKDTEYTNTYTPVRSDYRDDNTYDDSGSASRYFYCAKASKKDRDEGLESFKKDFVSDGCLRSNHETAHQYGATSTSARANSHPTVKPTELMQYLVRLVAPPSATILDPFNGSGSTGKAVALENVRANKNYKYIGFELEKEYVDISKSRIDYALNFGVTQKNTSFEEISLFKEEK